MFSAIFNLCCDTFSWFDIFLLKISNMVYTFHSCDTVIHTSFTDYLPQKQNNNVFIDDYNTCYYNFIDEACRKLNECWIGSINMGCIIGDNPSTFHIVLSRAGNHQYYTTNNIPSISFCKYAYTFHDSFLGTGFLKLGHNLICDAAKTGGFHLIRNGSRNMKITSSHC